MVRWTPAVTDRTQTDVDYIKDLAQTYQAIGWDNLSLAQQQEWLWGGVLTLYASDALLKTVDGYTLIVGAGSIKGTVNTTDLNRIQNNIVYLRNELESQKGIIVVIDESNPYWTREEDLFDYHLNVIRNNVTALVNGTVGLPTNPTIVYTDSPNFTDFNAIEQNLVNVYNFLIGG